jgi:hypothetical protein
MVGNSRDYMYLLERDIRRAMANTFSNRQAAKYLGISVPTFRRIASEYIDAETGKNLYELHKNEAGRGMNKTLKIYGGKKLQKILSGGEKQQNLSVRLLIRAMILNLIVEEKCSLCGFNERRPDNFEVPLLLEFLDGNKHNYKQENLRLICPNCYALKGGVVVASNVRGKSPTVKQSETTDYTN